MRGGLSRLTSPGMARGSIARPSGEHMREPLPEQRARSTPPRAESLSNSLRYSLELSRFGLLSDGRPRVVRQHFERKAIRHPGLLYVVLLYQVCLDQSDQLVHAVDALQLVC